MTYRNNSPVVEQPSNAVEEPFSWRDFNGPEYPERQPLPRTHGIRVASLTLSAHHPYKLDLFSEFAWQSAQSLGIPAARPAPLKKSKELITVIKAPFVYKKFQENFERRHHHREIVAYDANKETVDLWLRYVRNNSIGGVGLKATVHEWVDVGFGRNEIEAASQSSKSTVDQAVAEEAERLLKEMEEGESVEERSRGETEAATSEAVSR